MKRRQRYRRLALTVLALALLARGSPAHAQDAQIDTFFIQDWLDACRQSGYHAQSSDEKLVAMALEGSFLGLDMTDAMNLQVLAAVHPLLLAVPSGTISHVAAQAGVEEGIAFHAYHVSLSQTLRAEAALMPASDEHVADMRALLAPFLTPENTEADLLRGLLAPGMTSQVAQALSLPEEFTAFIMLDETWWDGYWQDDAGYYASSQGG